LHHLETTYEKLPAMSGDKDSFSLSRTGNIKKNTFVGMDNEEVHQQSQKETHRHDTEVRASKLFLQAGTNISFLQVVAFHLDPGVGGPEHRHIPLPVWLYFCKG
jgi:hypothetical protein